MKKIERRLDRNLIQRVASGVPALFVVLALVLWAPGWLLMAVTALLGVAGYREVQQMVVAKGLPMPLWPLVGAAAMVGAGGLAGGETGLHIMTPLALHLVLTTLFIKVKDRSVMLPLWGWGAFGLVWVVWSVNHLALLRGRDAGGLENAGLLVLLVLAVTFSDTFAYFTGKMIGRTPLAPAISPKKTVEGSIGGLVGGVLAGWLFSLYWPGTLSRFSEFEPLALGGALALLGQAGDLVESKVKRVCGVKDSGSFLPGHGGVLDRLDAFLLAGPAFYYYTHLLYGQG